MILIQVTHKSPLEKLIYLNYFIWLRSVLFHLIKVLHWSSY